MDKLKKKLTNNDFPRVQTEEDHLLITHEQMEMVKRGELVIVQNQLMTKESYEKFVNRPPVEFEGNLNLYGDV